jgi:hypothetical protein
MSAELDTLTAAVAAEDTVIDSAIALIQGLAAQIATLANAGDTAATLAAITALATDVSAKSAALSAAVTANTPAPAAPTA